MAHLHIHVHRKTTDRRRKTKDTKDASKGMQILERWYKQNPDDAGEYDVDEIMRRFGGSGVTRQEAEEMYRRIQKERYG